MIKKINKIKNLGLVFSDYSWDSRLSDFKQYNLIYGWTASGKTTLSKLFDALESGGLRNVTDLEYKVEDEKRNKFKQDEPFNMKVRVFNQDYVENNLKVRESKAKAITLILGDANKKIVEQIESDNEKLKEKGDEREKISEWFEQNKKNKNKIFTGIAKTIYVVIIGGAIRNYRKDDAELDFATLTKKKILSDDDLNKFSVIVKQSSQSPIDIIKKIEVESEHEKKKELSQIVKSLVDEARNLLLETVESQIINRIKNNQDISDWIETGLIIHNDHKSTNCEFCGQVLQKDRLSKLSKHFSEADKKLKQNVSDLLIKFSQIYNLIDVTKYPDKARFYDESQKDYEDCCEEYDREKSNLLKSIENIEDSVKKKKLKTTEVVVLSEDINTSKFTNSFKTISSFIDRHNKKTSDFENEKNNATNKLKNHYLSTIFDEVKNLEKEIKSCEETLGKLNDGDASMPDDLGIGGLKKRISENQAKISSTHKACDEINKGLITFLGRDELVFEPHKTRILDEKGRKQEVDDGYVIKRNGELANNLSEGEKTAIAFVYFTIHLKDPSFDLENGIVVIDDPVSSLDSNSLFQAFAFLKNAVRKANQIFILTHNFDFLKLLLNWIKNIDHGRHNSYYMIKNRYVNNIRCAYLDKMDKELCEYESEYHYLFKLLKQFKSNETIAQAYPIPNIARKVLDTFLLFRVPSGGGIYNKLEKIKDTTSFDANKLTAIYKFTNDQSHITGAGFDPALVPETQKNVKYLLEMIEDIFPEHYKILQESTS